MNFEKILNPVDGSPPSLNATRSAIELAALCDGRIILLHCHRKFPVILAEPHFQNAINAIMSQCDTLLAPHLEILDKSGISYETRVLEGAAGKVIPEVAAIEKIQLIVMGSRGCSDFEGLMLGSVAHKVLHSVDCPVLILK